LQSEVNGLLFEVGELRLELVDVSRRGAESCFALSYPITVTISSDAPAKLSVRDV